MIDEIYNLNENKKTIPPIPKDATVAMAYVPYQNDDNNKIATIDFALVDMHLFLDTHPDNTAIAKKINEYEEKSLNLKFEYENNYGPLTTSAENGNRWAWISNPWPWDSTIEEEC